MNTKTKTKKPRKKTGRALAVETHGKALVDLVDSITSVFEAHGDYDPADKNVMVRLIKDFVRDETTVLRDNLRATIAEIQEHQREYHHRTHPGKITFWQQLSVEPGIRTDIPMPRHMRSLQRCVCWKMRGLDDNTYPDPTCKNCRGDGYYIPEA